MMDKLQEHDFQDESFIIGKFNPFFICLTLISCPTGANRLYK